MNGDDYLMLLSFSITLVLLGVAFTMSYELQQKDRLISDLLKDNKQMETQLAVNGVHVTITSQDEESYHLPSSPSSAETSLEFPDKLVIYDYTIHFKDTCIIKDNINIDDCGGWVRDTYGWQHQIFLVKYDDSDLMRSNCNHERYHLDLDLTVDEEHEIMLEEGVPSYRMCDIMVSHLEGYY